MVDKENKVFVKGVFPSLKNNSLRRASQVLSATSKHCFEQSATASC
ncbi:hypothetical protein HMPREF1043_2229 [Streptococcus anginosus subsp. whileyi CCUG 39159]|uniref:Uncharacterized protein n=1 Tax=Streptococcus anginosus subsp. whileyi CCUG 39159 TaxID=1095729 RepID=I0S7Q4_STRAP|nr:hypothetical protein HMPREF1043_2229 [Streptococcus anginosus subsp. whileyi CCUG 39159]